MPGPRIPDTDHVSRLCGGSKCDDDGRPLGAAFMLRRDEPYLSVNWLESTGASNRAEQLAAVRRHLTDKEINLPAKGRLAVGYDGDVSLVDLKREQVIESGWLASKCGWSPFEGQTVRGWPVATVLRGQVIMRDGELIGRPSGRPVRFQETL